MKYWLAKCASCGEVKIAQKSKPTTCKEDLQTGERSHRLCGTSLSDVRDITEKVLHAMAVKRIAA